MKRRNFLHSIAISTAAVSGSSFTNKTKTASTKKESLNITASLKTDLAIIGGGLGGVAAAIAALRNGLTVVLTEETDWIGGQMTSQGVPPDEHPWIETTGAPKSYRLLRDGIRNYYKRNYLLTNEAKRNDYLNPGAGKVSRLCHEPKVALAVLNEMLAPYISTGRLTLLKEHKPIDADVKNTEVNSITIQSLRSNQKTKLTADYFVDATELGDLLPLTGTAYRTGTESKKETNEIHAPEQADLTNNQAFTICFAMDYLPLENHVIDKPVEYDFWRKHIPNLTPAWSGSLLDLQYSQPSTLKAKKLAFDPERKDTGELLNLWLYRRMIDKSNFVEGIYAGDITLVNWPQNDYMLGNIVDVDQQQFDEHIYHAKQLSLSLLYWLQTEAPRPDGNKGWPGLRLRKDIMGTDDGLAKYPYVRESRRIKAMFTVLEEHVGKEQWEITNRQNSKGKSARFHDSVGIGYYHIDLHPSSNGNNYIDFPSIPFEIPLGSLIPIKMDNIFPACKNIGTTHITNGCFRLHPVEWSIGEAVGSLISFSILQKVKPRQVREQKDLLSSFQEFLKQQGIEISWPAEIL
jgi:hypothetical protein